MTGLPFSSTCLLVDATTHRHRTGASETPNSCPPGRFFFPNPAPRPPDPSRPLLHLTIPVLENRCNIPIASHR